MFTQSVYSFKDVICLVGGIPITGFSAADDCIIVKRRSDVITATVGADGEATVSKSADLSVDITLKLLGTSASNSVIQSFLTTSDTLATVIVPLQIQNLSGLDMCSCLGAVISKQPDLQFGANISDREWGFFSNTARVVVGGSLQI